MDSDSFMNVSDKSISNSVSQMTPEEVEELRKDFKEAMNQARLVLARTTIRHSPK
ncbi:hypothetical protein ACY2LX_000621 [Acinetobacter baumannii]|uniref:Uncharacterized protein n=1 Tax=Acinetobacter baumannii TaxID=470 RepID=A0AAD2YPF5_ACIBA|nr:hypothetical protein [Acinetobacter baumannii]EHZ7473813.1 hypothetical protein [Acinetobacter baumannii]EKU2088828.1 hypothetical protein [Acinetobacter baumannii]EKU3566939.1 hypothetical protein [Acinetobacter baumannii]EKU3814989.1 hypothetical protein [Acinetobacter baumannii]EKU3845753.1 hypothetical protein [Acinetobacter baumannii]